MRVGDLISPKIMKTRDFYEFAIVLELLPPGRIKFMWCDNGEIDEASVYFWEIVNGIR